MWQEKDEREVKVEKKTGNGRGRGREGEDVTLAPRGLWVDVC